MWRKILHKTQISISADAGSQYQNNTFLTPYFEACKRGIFFLYLKDMFTQKLKFSRYLLTVMMMESHVKFPCPRDPKLITDKLSSYSEYFSFM